MKKIIVLTALLLLCALCVVPVAADTPTLMNDNADCFTDREERMLLNMQDFIGEKHACHVVVLTVNGTDGEHIADYAEQFFADGGYGVGENADGIMLTLNSKNGEFYASASGRCARVLTEDGYRRINDAVVDAVIKNDSYASGVDAFLEVCDELLTELYEVDDEPLALLIDRGGLLMDSEGVALAEKLGEISDRLECHIVVLTEESINGESAEEYADDYFDYNGYGVGGERDGILLLVSMEERVWHVSGSGVCNSEFFPDSAFDYICEYIEDDLGEGEYAECFDTFASRCDDVISSAREGVVFKAPFDIAGTLIMSAVIGFIAALIYTGILSGQLKSVGYEKDAARYLKADSLNLTRSGDIFLYRTLSVTPKPKDEGSSSSGGSRSHTSSSGRSHSGRGGSF